MAVRAVDKLLAGYVAFLTVVVLWRGPLTDVRNLSMLLMHALLGLLLFLFTRLRQADRVGQVIHDLYPIVMLVPFYAEFGLLNDQLGFAAVLANDAVIQRWETAVFGGQVSYTWIRTYPSPFWSGLLHLAYLVYYPIVVAGPIALVAFRRSNAARAVVLATMIAFVTCYVSFVLFPVGGPNYAFDHPDGAVRNIWSARLVYGILANGSSFGAAFPSSHVAATLAATLALVEVWRPVGLTFVVPCVLLIVGTVYCQMHYAVDATSGVAVGMLAYGIGKKWYSPWAETTVIRASETI